MLAPSGAAMLAVLAVRAMLFTEVQSCMHWDNSPVLAVRAMLFTELQRCMHWESSLVREASEALPTSEPGEQPRLAVLGSWVDKLLSHLCSVSSE
mmetsp:Transcript_104093/g.324548  ORF Transcript_104093/g.324548 Transcript_104093/m.324548 type:complete len:95 (-) Transcript_104093:338-622(-)